MKVSVIVPVYNHSIYLRQRLDSILNQTYKDYELIILDDASTDNSREIIEDYIGKTPGIIKCFNDHNSGSPFKQWNKGVSMASGEYIWIAESDDFADPDFLNKSVEKLKKSDNTGLVFCDTTILDEQKRIKYRFSDKKSVANVNLLTIKSFIRNPIPNVSSVLFRKRAYIKAGCANDTMKYCGDWLLYLRIKKNSEIKYIPEPLSTFRLHEHSRYHHHYSNNRFLGEKSSIYKAVIKDSGYSPFILFPCLINLFASLVIRIGFFINFPAWLKSELPRTPNKFEHI